MGGGPAGRPPGPVPWKLGDPVPVLTPAQKAENAALIQFVQAKHRELMAHLQAKYATDRRVQVAQVLFAGLQELTLQESLRTSTNLSKGQMRAGGYVPASGIMQLLVRKPPDILKDRDEMLYSYLHEMAHCMNSFNPGSAHSPTWRSILLWLLRVATQPPLNWDVALPCGQCGLYNLCSAAECARCTFKRCSSQVPQPRPIAEQEPPTRPAMDQYPPSTYERMCVRQSRPSWTWWTQTCARYRARLAQKSTAYARACIPRPITPAAAASCAKLKALGFAAKDYSRPTVGLLKSREITTYHLNALVTGSSRA